MKKINLKEKFKRFDDFWHPRIVGELNGQYVKIAKVMGEFPWHHHQQEDELFYVVKGVLFIEFRNRLETLEAGDMIIVPRGVEHRPHTGKEPAWIMLFEPKTTLNTGEGQNKFTKEKLDWI